MTTDSSAVPGVGREQEVICKARRAGRIGDEAERGARDHHRTNGETVEAVGEVHCVAGAHDHERPEGDEAIDREVEHEVLEERQREARGVAGQRLHGERAVCDGLRGGFLRVVRDPEHGDRGDNEFHQQADLAREARAVPFLVTF